MQDISVSGTAMNVTSVTRTLDDGTVIAMPPVPVVPSTSQIETINVMFDDGHSQNLDVSGAETEVTSVSVTDENDVVTEVVIT